MKISRTLPALTLALMLSGAAAPVAAAAAAQCDSGWAGTISYSRHQSNSNSKTEKRVSGKGTETSDWGMTYDYKAQVVVRATENPDLSTGLANISLNSVSTETKSANERFICPHERTPREMSGNFVYKSETRANESGLEAGVNISLDTSGTYSVSIGLPDVKGMVSGSNSASYSGQCKAKESVNQSLGDMPTTVDGVRFGSSGEDRYQLSDPNRLSGSHSVSLLGTTEMLTWNLRRCGGDLRLVDVKFEDMRFPEWGAWKDIVEQVGTIDGNLVRLTAIVANDGPDEKAATVKFRDTYKGDKWDGAKPDGLLGELSVSVPGGEQREVQFEWDSSGFSWFDDGRPRLVQRIKAEVEDRGKKIDDMTRNLKVAPKPIVLVHGLWSNWRAWETWQNILTTSHSYDWKAFPVGERPEHGRMNTGEELGNFGPTNTIAQNAVELGNYVRYAQKDRNAWHVDLVAHSMGGLISRRYIHATMPTYPDGKPQVSHLVMLGTPNMGSRCADLLSVPLETAGRSMDALRELRPSVVEGFNAENSNRKGVPFSILVGNPLPPACYMLSLNDGVVAVPSAKWTITDSETQAILHTSMTGTGPFSSFVQPRVALGPGKQASGDQSARAAATSARAPARIMITGVEGDKSAAPSDFSKVLMLAPGQTLDVSIPVKNASNFGLTFVAANTVSATLIDDTGAVAGANLTDTPEANQIFRSLIVNRTIAQGNWILKLHSKDRADREIILSTWSNAP
ncbi:Putative serine esterase [Sphingopyxis sp. YR583]|jgi:pimeloyl-ACP methyl ester carboxylesterase/opacity protein-like surface antigen|uniref:esterase/lipase family protein n=1 Tax=Sphingopyxis sp. YR583 TaxID=1881047 RepID=UPI0008A7ABFC|nr:alpha/beta fold hydrolase [Sphingopyxis sp. YR583]SEH17211.1 Putative serine esterase [Sphingopyxis sp. YR583]